MNAGGIAILLMCCSDMYANALFVHITLYITLLKQRELARVKLRDEASATYTGTYTNITS
jgi:hypothetical protein